MPGKREDSFVWDTSGGWIARLREPRPLYVRVRALGAALLATAAICAAIGLSPTGATVLEGVRESQVRATQRITVAVLVAERGATQQVATADEGPKRFDISRLDATGRAVFCRSMRADYVTVGDVSGSTVLVSGASGGRTWIESFSISACARSPHRILTSPVAKSDHQPSGWMCPSWSPEHRRVAATFVHLVDPRAGGETGYESAITETWTGDVDGAGWHKVADGIACRWLDRTHLLLGSPLATMTRILAPHMRGEIDIWPPVVPMTIDVETRRFAFFLRPELVQSVASPDGSAVLVFPLGDSPEPIYPARIVDPVTGAERTLDPELIGAAEPIVAWRADGGAFILLGQDISFYDSTGRRTRIIQAPFVGEMTAGWLDASSIWVESQGSAVIVRPDDQMDTVDIGRATNVDVTPVLVKPGIPRATTITYPDDVAPTTFPKAHLSLRLAPSWTAYDLEAEGSAPPAQPDRMVLSIITSRLEEVFIGWTTASVQTVIDELTRSERDPTTGEPIGATIWRRSATTMDGHPFVLLELLSPGWDPAFKGEAFALVGRVGGKTYLIRGMTGKTSPQMQMLLDSIRFEP